MNRKEYQRQYANRRYASKKKEINAKRRERWKTDSVLRGRSKAASRKRYQENKEEHKRNVRDRVEVNKKYVRDLKSQSSCSRCPEKHPACLDFHHPKGMKKHKLHQAFDISWSLDKIKAEIAKCDILCANCHRKEHWAYLYEI